VRTLAGGLATFLELVQADDAIAKSDLADHLVIKIQEISVPTSLEKDVLRRKIGNLEGEGILRRAANRDALTGSNQAFMDDLSGLNNTNSKDLSRVGL
jgi:hypothetical protein